MSTYSFLKLPEQLQKKIAPCPLTGCWYWMGKTRDGYGVAKRQEPAQQTVYREFEGAIPRGLQLDHLCRVRCCVNPAHLEPVTPRENTLRMLKALGKIDKTHCKVGHALTPDNVKWRVGAQGVKRRVCKTCARRWTRKNYHDNTPGSMEWKEETRQKALRTRARLGMKSERCKRGHVYALVGVYIQPKTKNRVCLGCRKENRHRRWIELRK